jgi:hypothetical protein
MSTRPTTAELKEAFMHVSWAIEHLSQVKAKLVEMHVASEEVDNSTFLVENHHRFASPDADTHDVLFARLEAAKAKLTEVIDPAQTGWVALRLTEAKGRLDQIQRVV